MNKKNLILICTIMALFFNGCRSVNGKSNINSGSLFSRETTKTMPNVDNHEENNITNQNDFMLITNNLITETGEYNLIKKVQSSLIDSPFILSFFDKSLGEQIILCNKPNCKHENEDCNAFFYDLQFQNKMLTATNLFIHNNYLFIQYQSKIYKLSMDGTNRDIIMTIPDKYNLYESWIYNNKLYCRFSEYKQKTNDINIASYIGIIEIDYIIGSFRECFSFEAKNDMTHEVIGFYENSAIVKKAGLIPETIGGSQASLDKLINQLKVEVLSFNLNTGDSKLLINSTAEEVYSSVMFSNMLYFQSRKNNTISRYNITNGDSEVIVSDCSGYYEINQLIDDHLIITKSNSKTNFYQDNPAPDEKYFIDLKTKEKVFIDIKQQSTNLPISTEYIKHGYLYFVYDSRTENNGMSDLYARIKLSDFWSANFNKVEKLEWTTDPLYLSRI